ncbi:heavy metal-binding domain-containing protein [Methanobrevibacter sp. DSM 116169]|uniref:heavy metal-binding domain-containing protein n=1 Tax=Methanobrevibacter sp. DSM 116169 TaxID=3242727 RepID=UPI0038FD01BF
MKLDIPKERLTYLREAGLCISLGTISGLLTYFLFLYFGIDIFGWNLGLIFAPLVAGYVETYLSNKIIGESIGAISAFILFLVTVIYGFIIANSTLGINIITGLSIVVILQAALPTLINYFLLVVIIGIISYAFGFFKKITDYLYYKFSLLYYDLTGKPITHKLKKGIEYDENISNIDINDLGILFISSEDLLTDVTKYIGVYEGKTIFPKDMHIVSVDFKGKEKKVLHNLQKAKDQALLNLSEDAKKDGCNCILNLSIEYDSVGFGGDSYQVVAKGTGVRIG